MSDLASELARLDGVAQAEKVKCGELTPGELLEAAIERLERHNDRLNAVIHPALEAGRARAASKDLEAGSFHGVPFLMKDTGSLLQVAAAAACVIQKPADSPRGTALNDREWKFTAERLIIV